MTDTVKEAALRLKAAYAGEAIDPLRLGRSDLSTESAYAIQEANTNAWLDEGRRLVGRKIGLTSKAVQAQLGVDQPDYGMLFSESTFCSGDVLSLSRFIQPKVEAEIAFVLKEDLVSKDLTVIDVLKAVDYAVAALEIVDSRIRDWDISLFDTIADNASYGAFVMGTQPVSLKDIDLEGCEMRLSENGEVVSEGQGKACLGNPLLATLWLAKVMVDAGWPLKAGDVVLSGALGPMVPVKAGADYIASIDGLGRVSVSFSADE